MNMKNFQNIQNDSKLITFFFNGNLKEDYTIEINDNNFKLENVQDSLNELFLKGRLRKEWIAKKNNKIIIISMIDINQELTNQKRY